eukprot:Gb_14216 [translate_table: standard]
MDYKNYIDISSITQNLLGDLAKMRELLDKFEVPKESKEEFYRKKEQLGNVYLDIPKFNFSRLEYLFKKIEIRHVRDKEDKNLNCKNINEEFKGEKCMIEKNEEEEPVEMNNVPIPVDAIKLDLEISNIQDVIIGYKETSIQPDEVIKIPKELKELYKEKELEYEETQEKNTQEKITEDKTHKPMVDEQEADTLEDNG